MAKSYQQIQKQIDQLQRQAEALRSSEIEGVVERIKVAISHYGLTAAQLGLATAGSSVKLKARARASVIKGGAQFSDVSGNVWSGHGPRPRWLRDALSAGRSLDEFRILSSASQSHSDATQSISAKGSKKAKRAPSKVNYTDGTGNTWTGRGPRPRWLKAALENGKSLQDFLQ